MVDQSTNTAVIALIGIIVGAVLTYRFKLSANLSEQYEALKSQAYLDFVGAAAGISIAQKTNDTSREAESLELMTNAKIRIAILGSKNVASKTADFFRNYGALDSPDAYMSFDLIIQEMRKDLAKNEEIEVNDINQLLFSED